MCVWSAAGASPLCASVVVTCVSTARDGTARVYIVCPVPIEDDPAQDAGSSGTRAGDPRVRSGQSDVGRTAVAVRVRRSRAYFLFASPNANPPQPAPRVLKTLFCVFPERRSSSNAPGPAARPAWGLAAVGRLALAPPGPAPGGVRGPCARGSWTCWLRLACPGPSVNGHSLEHCAKRLPTIGIASSAAAGRAAVRWPLRGALCARGARSRHDAKAIRRVAARRSVELIKLAGGA